MQLSVAQRAEIVLDFTQVRTGRVIMRNVPMPAQAETDIFSIPSTVAIPPEIPSSTDEIMSFTPNIFIATPIKKPPVIVLNSHLNIFPFISRNPEPKYYALTATLNAQGLPIGVQINGVKLSGENDVFKMDRDYDLYFINLMPIPHPMHMHLVNFQVYKRAPLDSFKYGMEFLAVNPGAMPFDKLPNSLSPENYLTGPWERLGGVHRVWRDVTEVSPDAVNVVRLRFMYNTMKRYGPDIRGSMYVIHCHILEHEDNEMMLYFTVE